LLRDHSTYRNAVHQPDRLLVVVECNIKGEFQCLTLVLERDLLVDPA
jgi:hypothetical protein